MMMKIKLVTVHHDDRTNSLFYQYHEFSNIVLYLFFGDLIRRTGEIQRFEGSLSTFPTSDCQ